MPPPKPPTPPPLTVQALRQQLDALGLADAEAEGGTQRPARPLGPHEVLAVDGVDVHWPTATVGPPLAPQQELMEKLLRAVPPPPTPAHTQ